MIMTKLILASQSPRRRELLGQMGLTDFAIIPAVGEEHIPQHLPPAQVVEELSRQKALEIAAQHPDAIVIGADTVVALGDLILGKPKDEADAIGMLTALSGNSHTVYTGFTVCCGHEIVTAHEATTVHFRSLTQSEIAAYVATGEPLDKAGSYGIQGRGGLLVEGISGDYCNVVGLPICQLGLVLRGFGVALLA